jgi:1-acyl-sn-glycerol-3-phosphate acyltransferase
VSRRESWPGRQLRRLVTAPVVILLTVLIGLTLPLWLVAAAALSPVLPGRWRPLRLLWVVIGYLVCESVLLVVLFGLWVSSGFGARIRTPYYEGIHYDLVQGTLWIFFREARRVLNLSIETAGPTPDAYPGKPLLVCCRHAGPGDSFTLVYALMHWYEREPRVVLKDTLAWDPVIDVVLHRIPARFITPNPERGGSAYIEQQIAELATGLDENDAFVIFPEGGNFTPRRRERGIQRLHRLGMHRMARRAEAMTNVLAPRPGGVIAALNAAPEADVVMVAHTGMDHLLTVGDVWRELPMDKRLVMQWWQVPRGEIPVGRDAQIDWLFGWWEKIDDWIDEHRAEDLPPRRPRKSAGGFPGHPGKPSDVRGCHP